MYVQEHFIEGDDKFSIMVIWSLVYMFSNCQKAFGEFLSHYTIFGGFETNIWPHSLIFFFSIEARNQLREKLN